MSRQRQLLQLLSDGRFHSGERLGRELGVSRAAVWKLLEGIRKSGIALDSVKGRGYRLRQPIELLDPDSLLELLSPEASALLGGLEIHEELDSTNRHLLRRSREGLVPGAVCLAESQTAGRGRRGRTWVSPYASNIYLSLYWEFEQGAAQLSGLSLAVAVSVATALNDVGIEGVGVKWPNDLLVADRKLGGILLEMSGEPTGVCQIVVGIGLNVRMPPEASDDIDQPWSDVASLCPDISRSRLTASLLDRLLKDMQRFSDCGFEAFRAQWTELDLYKGRQVHLLMPHRTIEGVARGVDETGALLLEDQEGGLQRFMSGEVTVRPRCGNQ